MSIHQITSSVERYLLKERRILSGIVSIINYVFLEILIFNHQTGSISVSIDAAKDIPYICI